MTSPPSPPEPTTRDVGPYRLGRLLGRGGMSLVYEATLLERGPVGEAGELVALKLIPSDLPDAEAAARRLAEEARLGLRVDHPSVVRTLHHGATADGPFLALELVPGRDLRRFASEHAPLPEPLIRHVGIQIAEALGALHDAGLAHGDLKPANVVFTPSQRIKLIDLGVAVDLDAVSTRAGFRGSPDYAAPEQFAGTAPTVASDLYSLGVLLYELASGRQPFKSPTLEEAARRHREHRPEPLEEIREELSAVLVSLVATLLAKSPTERVSDAATVVEALRRGEESEWWRSSPDGRRASSPWLLPQDVDIPARLFGRSQERAALDAAGRAARAGDGSTLLLTGEAGIGKSALVARWVLDLRSRVRMVSADFASDSSAGEIPWQTLWAGGDAADADLRVCWLRNVQDSRERDWRALRTALYSAADEAILFLLEATPGLGPDREEELRHLPRFRSIRLGGLESDEACRLLTDSLPSEDCSERSLRAVAKTTGGNPLLLKAWLRARSSNDRPATSSLPRLVEQQLASLSDDQRELLHLATLDGRRVTPEVLARALGREPLEVLESLATLSAKLGVLQAEGASYRFSNELVPRAIAESLDEEERTGLHVRLAQAWSRESGAARDARLERCWHWLHAGRPEALDDLEQALQALDPRRSPKRTNRLAVLGLSLLAERPEHAELSAHCALRAAVSCSALERPAEANRHAEAALRHARDSGRPDLLVEALNLRVTYLAEFEDSSRLLPHLRESLVVARSMGDARLLAEQHVKLGMELRHVGDLDGSRASFDAALAAAPEEATHERAVVRVRLAQLEMAHSRYERAAELAAEALELLGPNQHLMRAEALRVQGQCLGLSNDLDGTMPLFERALEEARASGNPTAIEAIEGDLAVMAQYAGRTGEARRAFHRKAAIAEATGKPSSAAQAHVNLAVGYAAGNLVDEARHHAERAREFALEAGDPRLAAHALVLLGQEAAREDPAGSLPMLEEAVAEFERLGIASALGSARLQWGIALARSGRVEEGVAILEDLARPGETGQLEVTRLHARSQLCRFGRLEAADVEVPQEIPATDRIHVRLVLHAAGGAPELLEKAREDLLGLVADLGDEDRETTISAMRSVFPEGALPEGLGGTLAAPSPEPRESELPPDAGVA